MVIAANEWSLDLPAGRYEIQVTSGDHHDWQAPILLADAHGRYDRAPISAGEVVVTTWTIDHPGGRYALQVGEDIQPTTLSPVSGILRWRDDT